MTNQAPLPERIAKIDRKLERALDAECADYNCDGFPSRWCPKKCAVDERMEKLLADLTRARGETGDWRPLENETRAKQCLGLLPPDPKSVELLKQIFGAENVRDD